MKLIYIREQASLLVPSGTSSAPDKKHLFVILTNPWSYQGSKKIILSSFSTIKIHHQNFDKTCVIIPSDKAHEFIINDSFIDYRHSRILENDRVHHAIDTDIFIEKGLVSELAYQKICTGLLISKFTPRKIKIAYKDYIKEGIA